MKVNKIFAIIQLALMYLSIVSLLVYVNLDFNIEDLPTAISAALLITGLVAIVLAGLIASAICVISFISIFKKGTNNYTKLVMIHKIVAIPWFIGNFVFSVLLIGGMLNPFLLWGIPVVIAILVTNTYICMLSTSMMNVGYLISSWKNKVLKPSALLIIGLILEFHFCLDFLGAIFIFSGSKKQLSEEKQ